MRTSTLPGRTSGTGTSSRVSAPPSRSSRHAFIVVSVMPAALRRLASKLQASSSFGASLRLHAGAEQGKVGKARTTPPAVPLGRLRRVGESQRPPSKGRRWKDDVPVE